MPNVFSIAAQQLGFVMNPPDAGLFSVFDIRGQSDGHLVRIQREPMIRRLRTDVFFQTPFDLGFHVAPAGQPSFGTPVGLHRTLGRVFGGIFRHQDMRIGDKELDDLFDISGDEERRVAPLLETARDALIGWYRSEVAFDIDDAHVSVRRYSSLTTGETPESICADVQAALTLARRFEAARATLPAAAALTAHENAFRSLATEHRLSLTTSPLAVWGPMQAFGLWAHATRVKPNEFELEVVLQWPAGAAPFGGVVRSAANLGTTAPAPNATFESVFDANVTLSGEAREALLELRKLTHYVALDAHGLVFRAPLGTEPFPLARCVQIAATAMQSAGPYR